DRGPSDSLRHPPHRRGALPSRRSVSVPGTLRRRPKETRVSLLSVAGVSKRFGGLQAVRGLSLTVHRGEVLGLIGPNGAGKTTALNLLSGFLRPDAGEIRFDGTSIVGWRPHAICQAGLARTFQIVRPFPRLSVLGNVEVGALARHDDVRRAREQARAVIA